MNNITLVGRITHELDLKKTKVNDEERVYCRFSIAVQRRFDNDKADFFNCIVWGNQAENLVKYMTKGSRIGLIGRLSQGSYEHEKGITITTYDVIADSIQFLETKKETEGAKIKEENLPF